MGKASRALACIYKPLGWFPVIVINGIAVWSYFAYVVILCLGKNNIANKMKEPAIVDSAYLGNFCKTIFWFFLTVFLNNCIAIVLARYS